MKLINFFLSNSGIYSNHAGLAALAQNSGGDFILGNKIVYKLM